MVLADPKRGENTEALLYTPNGLVHILEPFFMPDQDGWLAWAQILVEGWVEKMPRWGITDRNIREVYMNEEGRMMGLPETQVDGVSEPVCGNVLVYRRKA
tara:strand:- start:233 stop:532 length:300 start_codon:yes stop_codon:yes gene_type:complete